MLKNQVLIFCIPFNIINYINNKKEKNMDSKKLNKILVVIIILLVAVIAFLSFELYKGNEDSKNVGTDYHIAILNWKSNTPDSNLQNTVEVFVYDDENVITHKTAMTFLSEELANEHYNGLDKTHYSAEVNANTVNITENIKEGAFTTDVVSSVISEYENQKENDSGELSYVIY